MKRMQYALLLAAIVAAMVLPVTSGDAASGSDPRLTKALEKAGLKYTTTKDGDCKLLFNLDEDRTHIVWAESNTETVGDFEIREVWAAGWQGDSQMDSDDMTRLLKENAATKIGAWELLEDDGSFYAVFTAKIPADLPSAELKTILGFISAKADGLEKDLLDSDDL